LFTPAVVFFGVGAANGRLLMLTAHLGVTGHSVQTAFAGKETKNPE
jgi:hypothetical protein